MEFQHLPIFTFLSLALVASHAALSPEAYWKSMLPNTPMPMTVKNSLSPELTEEKEKSTSIGIDKSIYMSRGGSGTSSAHVAGPAPFAYVYGATADQLHDNRDVALFFLEKDMKLGTKMTLHFTKSTKAATFLPRQVSEKIPFSSDKFSKILNHFSVKPNSMEAEIMMTAIRECEDPGIKGEEKYCATSLESMIDFSTSKLGKSIRAVSTEVQKETPLQNYSISGVMKIGDKTVVCHKQNYAYAVFYCHKTNSTKAYMVSMTSADDTKIKAVAVCHSDTSAWNPKHLAFLVLKVKPGTVPICHFLSEDHLVWVPSKLNL